MKSAADTRHQQVITELVHYGIVPPGAGRDRVVLENSSMSHESFRVTVDRRPVAFVKLHDPARLLGRNLTSEAATYRLAWFHPRLAQHMPFCQAVSPDDSMIVLELLAAPSSQWAMVGPGNSPGRHQWLADYGLLVADVHETVPAPFGNPPWFFGGTNLLRSEPHHPAAELSARLASSPALKRAAIDARRDWEARSLIHGDLRWANLIPRVAQEAGVSESSSTRLCLVDWELAGLGDAAWDLGGVLADLIASNALPTGTVDPTRVVGSLAAFSSPYRSRRRIGGVGWRDLTVRAARCTSLRLAQTLHEWGQVDHDTAYRLEPELGRWMFELAVDPHSAASSLWASS